MGFHLRGYTFLCDQGFGSYGQNKFWVQYIKYRRVQRNRRARGRPPAGAYSTSHDLRGHVIRVYPRVGAPRVLRARVTSCLIRACDVMPYPRACDVIIRVYPCVIVRVQPQGRLLFCFQLEAMGIMFILDLLICCE